MMGVCGRAVNTSNSGPGGPGFKSRPSRSFLRQLKKVNVKTVLSQKKKTLKLPVGLDSETCLQRQRLV